MKIDDAEARQRIEDFMGKEKADELFKKMLDTSDIKKKLKELELEEQPMKKEE